MITAAKISTVRRRGRPDAAEQRAEHHEHERADHRGLEGVRNRRERRRHVKRAPRRKTGFEYTGAGGRRVAKERRQRRIGEARQVQERAGGEPREDVPADTRIAELPGQQPRPRDDQVRPVAPDERLERQVEEPRRAGVHQRDGEEREEPRADSA
jgi:hypothetical protein